MQLDLAAIRADFPFFRENPDVIYLDSAATSLKPQAVIDEVSWFLSTGTSSINRAVHHIGVETSSRVRKARQTIANWFGVTDSQVVFTSGTTDAINLVRSGLSGLERVLVSNGEHHSNLLPWRSVSQLRTIDSDSFGVLTPERLAKELKDFPADLVSVSHLGNVLGIVQPIQELSEVVHSQGGLLLVDAAQSASHLPCSLETLNADFLVCSGHKMLGPSGIGALIGKREALERLNPTRWGGGMVSAVTESESTLEVGPGRFEAGTLPIESILGWSAAIEYLDTIGIASIDSHLSELTAQTVDALLDVPGVRLGGNAKTKRHSIVPFTIEHWQAHQAARVLSQRYGVCVRSGFHCAEPVSYTHLTLPTKA